ncbi:alpha/beta-hydrolase [Plenodomus tracheiphilus IPT5]|uniref:Alpha/beta-hydrolase n=1 Tax=Plenodomus tracheiphilus IPT5 TaxID=1408161 RepID=A0A6A7ATY1_9PLEO|nr:alpha/beta-hydrolase [Plenodomus tracheiphilus IPT5]
MSKPIIVFAPGAWHTPDCFDIAREQLHQRGWETETVAYPSVGAEPPNKGLADDAAALRSTLERLSDDGKEIVLVVHSYGGLVGQNALEGLGYKQRQAVGKKGGVIIFVYLAAFVVPKGATIKVMLGGQLLPWMHFDGEYGYAATPEVVFYHDLNEEAQKTAIAKLKHQSARVFTDEVTYEPWHDILSMYFFCEGDKALPLPVQQQMAQMLGADTPTFKSVGSHSPFLSQPQEVVEGLEYAAKVGQSKK